MISAGNNDVIDFADDHQIEDIQFNGETALLLEKLIDLKGECFFNVFIGKLFVFLKLIFIALGRYYTSMVILIYFIQCKIIL